MAIVNLNCVRYFILERVMMYIEQNVKHIYKKCTCTIHSTVKQYCTYIFKATLAPRGHPKLLILNIVN